MLSYKTIGDLLLSTHGKQANSLVARAHDDNDAGFVSMLQEHWFNPANWMKFKKKKHPCKLKLYFHTQFDVNDQPTVTCRKLQSDHDPVSIRWQLVLPNGLELCSNVDWSNIESVYEAQEMVVSPQLPAEQHHSSEVDAQFLDSDSDSDFVDEESECGSDDSDNFSDEMDDDILQKEDEEIMRIAKAEDDMLAVSSQLATSSMEEEDEEDDELIGADECIEDVGTKNDDVDINIVQIIQDAKAGYVPFDCGPVPSWPLQQLVEVVPSGIKQQLPDPPRRSVMQPSTIAEVSDVNANLVHVTSMEFAHLIDHERLDSLDLNATYQSILTEKGQFSSSDLGLLWVYLVLIHRPVCSKVAKNILLSWVQNDTKTQKFDLPGLHKYLAQGLGPILMFTPKKQHTQVVSVLWDRDFVYNAEEVWGTNINKQKGRPKVVLGQYILSNMLRAVYTKSANTLAFITDWNRKTKHFQKGLQSLLQYKLVTTSDSDEKKVFSRSDICWLDWWCLGRSLIGTKPTKAKMVVYQEPLWGMIPVNGNNLAHSIITKVASWSYRDWKPIENPDQPVERSLKGVLGLNIPFTVSEVVIALSKPEFVRGLWELTERVWGAGTHFFTQAKDLWSWHAIDGIEFDALKKTLIDWTISHETSDR